MGLSIEKPHRLRNLPVHPRLRENGVDVGYARPNEEQNDDDCVEQSPARQSVEMHGPARALAAELAAELVAALNILVILK